MARYSSKKTRLSSYVDVEKVIAVLCALAAVLVAVSLGSFNPHDASWFYYSSKGGEVQNVAGALGAEVAALCFYLLGTVAYLLIPFLMYTAYYAYYFKTIEGEWDRFAASCACIVTVSGLFHWYHAGSKPYMIAGGYVGQTVVQVLEGFLEKPGTLVFLYMFLLIVVLVITRISFIALMRGIKKSFVLLYDYRHIWLVPMLRLVRTLTYAIQVPIVWTVKQLWGALRGADVQEAEESVFAFEKGENGQLEETDGAFWNEYIERQSHTGIMPYSSATAQPMNEETEGKSVKKRASVQPNQRNTRKSYAVPSPALFAPSDKETQASRGDENKQLAITLEEKLERFGVYGKVVAIKPGPVITLFEYQPDIDAKVSKILALEHDLAMALEAMSVRIVAPIPGTNKVGFEVANKERKSVRMGDIIRSVAFQRCKAVLPLVLGQDTSGENVIVDLIDMPHLLVAGSTGSGKSVALNAMLASLLCKLPPDELKLIIIDPKRLEFAAMHDIAHLLFPVITEARRAAPVVRWLVRVMEERYELMASLGVRSIFDYKKMCKQKGQKDELPFIVMIIDELADLMMVAGKDIEDSIARLAQMARAAGIHLIIATQRPSVDVLTGVIKVNFPSRMSFRVTSKIDSRTILDTGGAESLLGKGDMLFMNAQSSRMRRVHGAYVSDAEINAMVNHIRAQQKVEYTDLQEAVAAYKTETEVADEPLLPEVLEFLKTIDDISISSLQRRFKIGYNRSARLIELLEGQGKIMPASGSKMRKVIH
ncbi:MAG: S-DNA-T family DNA segregation ATPase FtsK/SpoIIIE [Alteromonas naphthalenivorans]|jgi:S-DNA-T family DNA segregation ATPase FtsK/SpoIIIE